MWVRSAIPLVTLLFAIIYASDSLGQTAYEPLDPGGHIYLIEDAKETEELFVRRGLRFNDPELQEIVDRVVKTIVPPALDEYIQYRVHLIRDPSPLAFSLADGQIYLHTGLLARLDSEAQLAAVLAHEAHHIAMHDHIRANKSRRTKSNVFGGIAFAMAGANLHESMAGGTWGTAQYGLSLRSKFSDSMEFDADAGSIGLIGRAGYAPVASLQALNTIMQDPELSTPSPLTSWTTLESLSKRQQQLQQLVDELPGRSPSSALGSNNRPLVLRRIIEMTVDDYIRVDRPGIAVELIDSMIADQPSAFLLAAKGDAHQALGPRPVRDTEKRWKWQERKRDLLTRDELLEKYMEEEDGPTLLANNTKIAIESYNSALELDETTARAHLGLGNLYLNRADYRHAGRNYIKYLKLSPDSLDRPLVLEKLQQIKTELMKQKETE